MMTIGMIAAENPDDLRRKIAEIAGYAFETVQTVKLVGIRVRVSWPRCFRPTSPGAEVAETSRIFSVGGTRRELRWRV
jgi:hypothetical protein